jgi:hypothetical protein
MAGFSVVQVFRTWPHRNGVEKLNFSALAGEAAAECIGVPLDHDAKRRKIHTLGWLNKHFDAINPILPQFVFEDNQGNVVGQMAEQYKAGKAANPDRPSYEGMRKHGFK